MLTLLLQHSIKGGGGGGFPLVVGEAVNFTLSL